jgi:hypothetical protein
MKPVVSSLVALALAIAPLAAMASTSEKSAHHGKATIAKVVKHKPAKLAKADVEVSAKAEKKVEKPLAKVKHAGKKPALHHASNVDVSGGGHKEPKIERGVSVVPASLMTKTNANANAKLTKVSATSKAGDLPKLPNPNAQKPGVKNAAEKGARKTADKKNDDASSDGKPERDEDSAELVARIRGPKSAQNETTDKTDKTEPKGKHGSPGKQPTCAKDPVEVIRGPEIAKFELTKCDGSIAPLAVEQLSILIRPGSAARPTTPIAELAKKKGQELAHGIRRVDPRLVERIQAVVDHFAKSGASPKLSIISGYRPTSVGSMHSTGRAIDFRMEGVKNEDVVAFCKTLGDTGCGFYPNSSFVHIDVRDAGSGHVAWIDASGPGETPRYVSAWPPPESPKAKDAGEMKRPADVLEHTSARRVDPPLDREAASEPVDEHPADADDEDRERNP